MLNYILNFFDLIPSETFFWFCALAGSGMFAIQFLLNLFGVADHDDLDAGDVGDEGKFKRLSMQAISGFLMMFGWTALTCQKEFGFQGLSTISISFAIGLLTIFITSSIFKIAKKLQSSGNVYNLDEAIGKEAFVYHRIPKGGVGKISISLQHLTYEIDAIANNQEELPSFTRVQVIKTKDGNTVVVKAI
jgi:hypothetical protein